MQIATETTVVLAMIAFVAIIMARNELIVRRNAVDNSFAGIDTQLTKRYDLIPNLVTVVKQYAQHENETLRALGELRAQAMRSGLSTDDRVRLNNQIDRGLSGVLATSENYPQLRASENFQQLQRGLNEVEEQIAASRRAFNAAVNDFNNAVTQFPLSIVAGLTGFRPHAYFEATGESRQAIDTRAQLNS